jgi:GTP-binding protein Era
MTNNNFKVGYVAVAGKPNVGKSTLINALLGQKIAAVSMRPQTTRRSQLGILTRADAQVIFVDTPGLHKPIHKLGEYMNHTAVQALEDCDVALWLVDGSAAPTAEDSLAAVHLRQAHKLHVLIVANKADLVPEEQRPERLAEFQALYLAEDAVWISARSGWQVDRLLEMLLAKLPAGEAFFPEDQITDLIEREISAELLREAALIHLRDEVPHSLAVRIDEYKDRPDGTAYIAATLFVERESHKGIVIGKGGEMLKKIGTHARKEIESMSGHKAYLELRVKVNPNWRENPSALKGLGYGMEGDNK